MQIFQQEYDDGVSDLVKSTGSISYASVASPMTESNIAKASLTKDLKTLASIEDEDLYYVQSILVTSSWNKNDDIFDKIEVWNAKSTPTHKPTNLDHDENTIIGHITSNWPMTEDGVLIDENTPTDNLPDKFHILTGSVIYKGFTEAELKDRANKLISEIENGSKYVSMECFFKGFDYGLINKDTGEYKVLARNNETAYLTKYLRAYGGLGEHENYKIGRVLRNITFSGKGFVDRPANPDSIIFGKDSLKFVKAEATSDSDNKKNDVFSEESVSNILANVQETNMNLETEVTELKQRVEAMNNYIEKLEEVNTLASNLKDQLAEAMKQVETKDSMTKEYMDKLNVSEEDKKKMKAEFDAAMADLISNHANSETELKAQIEALQAEIATYNETIAAYKNKEMEMMKKEKKMKRMASLAEAGLDSETVSATVEKFEALDDESFEAVTSLVVLAAKKAAVNVTPEAVAQESNSVETVAPEQKTVSDDTQILENAEPVEDVSLSVGSDTESEVDNTRAALIDFVYSRLGKKLNKGE